MKSILDSDQLQLWGGIECTVNRVGDIYHDQLVANGHAEREEDLECFAELKLTALRYPVLWERTMPGDLHSADWRWSDRRLGRLKQLEIAPIVGLVHHGSGPPHTSLLDYSFVSGLSRYAEAVAQRYPWIEAYTPVNEPLTTARFSGLYGHWYPHACSDDAFATSLVIECLATAEAMRAIRRINSAAKLVLTEDLAKIHSTPHLANQAAFENQRRWLSVDLLLGRVTPSHRLWKYMARTPQLIDWLTQLADAPMPPDLLGFNYYLTSERLLDERLKQYPAWTHGGNSRMRYADVEAVRVRSEGIDGPERLLHEAWTRYGLPLAITEVHLGGHREDQLRWVLDSWNIAHDLRGSGVDVRAIALWSLLGSYDWNSLCTRTNGCYESGVFDVRSGKPRPTALAALAKQLATQSPVDTTAIPSSGWWRTEQRLAYKPVSTGLAGRKDLQIVRLRSHEQQRPLLIVGDQLLNRAISKVCAERSWPFIEASAEQFADSTIENLAASVNQPAPWAALDATPLAWSHNPEEAGTQLDPLFMGVKQLALQCAQRDIPLLSLSSDGVFNGSLQRRFVESDAVSMHDPRSQRLCMIEQWVGLHERSLIVRSTMPFHPWCERNLLVQALGRLAVGQPVWAEEDCLFAPTYIPDLVHACLDLLVDSACGIWHLVNREAISLSDVLRQAARAADLSADLVYDCSDPSRDARVTVGRSCVLASERGWLLPPLSDALDRYGRAVAGWFKADGIHEYSPVEEATDVA